MMTAPPGGPTSAPADPPRKAHTSETENRFLNFRDVLARQYQEWRQLPEDNKIRHVYLDSHGLTETGLDLLPQQDRAAHEEKIAELTRKPLTSNTPLRGSAIGDALSRAVITLQSVLDIHEARDVNPGLAESAEDASRAPATT